MTRLCRYCFAPLVRNEGESEQSWLAREYCNKSHAAKHREERKRK